MRETGRIHRGGYNSQYLRDHHQLRATRRVAASRRQPTEAGVVPRATDREHRIASLVSHANRNMRVQRHHMVERSILVIVVIVRGITLENVLTVCRGSVAVVAAVVNASG